MKEIQYCKFCGQKMMVYRRSIRPNMLHCLKTLFERFKYEPARERDLTDKRVLGSDFTKLRYWGLIEGMGLNSYRTTPFGVRFLRGEVSIRKYRWIYNNKVQKDDPFQANPHIRAKDIDPAFLNIEKVLDEANTAKIHEERTQKDLFHEEAS